MGWAYYNEHDPFAAEWLRELILHGYIADGEVDERDIQLVSPEDLNGFVQCHFFAGIGGWSYALRLAGWPEDQPVWTGSCPCQPFSAAGAQRGTVDARHLWPVWARLIAQYCPPVVFGEQVESALRHGWLDLVRTDLERHGYAVGAADLCAAGVQAPHLRQRVYFVADRLGQRSAWEHALLLGEAPGRVLQDRAEAARGGEAGDLAHAEGRGQREHGCASGGAGHADQREPVSCMGLSQGQQHNGRRNAWRGRGELTDTSGGSGTVALPHVPESSDRDLQRGGGLLQPPPDPVAGEWAAPDWILCSDGKSRPVEPGTFPLAHGVSVRVGRLRGYGNAIVPQVAAEVIRAYLEARGLA